MEEKLETQRQSNEIAYRRDIEQEASTTSVAECLPEIAHLGGMRFLKNLFRDIQNLDPQGKATRKIFLNDSMYREAREKLLKELCIWIDVLGMGTEDVDELKGYCLEEISKAQDLRKRNLEKIRLEISDLERTYRTLDAFFQNASPDGEPVRNLNVMNVSRKNIHDVYSEDGQIVTRELVSCYDNLDLRESYSLLVIPDFFRYPADCEKNPPEINAVDLRAWAKVVNKNKCLLLTDFEDCYSYQELCDRLDEKSLQDADKSASSVVLACNHILARRRSEKAEEDDDFYIPSSAALAGRMTDTKHISIAQGVAGQRFGAIERAYGVRFKLLKSEIAALMDKGVVPMIENDGRVMAFSNNTLYIGANKWLQEYPIVRVFDWVNKVIMHFCNSEALIVWDAEVRHEMEIVLSAFLEQYKGHGKLYEDYILKQILQDKETKNIHVNVEIKPFYAAKNFLIELTGENTKTSVEWEDNIVYLG